jgi:ferritin-like metal-binding protein YciE
MNALKSIFLNELADMYDAENRVIKALPGMIRAATCEELQQALQQHLGETQDQVTQIEKVFAALDEEPQSKTCPAMRGILEEGDRLAYDSKGSPAINAAIISACQKVKHYEIAAYGTLRTWADVLGNIIAADLLQEILDQEKEADHKLNELAFAKNQETLDEVAIGCGASA